MASNSVEPVSPRGISLHFRSGFHLPALTLFSGMNAATRGRLLMIASAAGFALMGLFVKLVPATISSHEKVFFRSLLGLMALVAWIAARKAWPSRPVNVRGLVWRGAFGAAALLLFFYAIDTAGLTKAMLYSYTYPLFAVVFAWFDLGERPGRATMAALAVAVLGTLLTLNMQGMQPQMSAGEIAGLASGVLSGAAVTSIRKLRRTESSTWIVIAFLAASVLASVPFMWSRFVMPQGIAWLLLGGAALTAMVSQMAMTEAYKALSAVEGSVMSLATVPLSAALAVVFLGEMMSVRFLLGGALVLGACALLCLTMSDADVAQTVTVDLTDRNRPTPSEPDHGHLDVAA
jgi:drug/metabolite transporter (DMT)-like permease